MAAILLACVVLLLSFCYIFTKNRKQYRFPPGPKGIPVLGNLLQMDMKNFSTGMSNIGKKYGEVCYLNLVNQNVVFISSYETMKETLTTPKYSQIFSGRPSLFFQKYIAKGTVGISTYSQEWLAFKKVVFRGMKTYGSHLADVEELVHGQLKNLTERILRDADTSVDPHDYVQGFVAGILTMLLTGQSHQHTDPILQLCTEIVLGVDDLLSPNTSALLTHMPWLRLLPMGCGKVYKKLRTNLELLRMKVFDKLKLKREKTCFLEFILDEKDKGNANEDNISGVIVDMLVGGTGTSHASLYSMFLVLATNPEIQARVQAEIDREIGSSRLPCIEDRNRMPYTHAVVWELLRFYPASPLSLPHCTMDDVEFREYFLPKDTVKLAERGPKRISELMKTIPSNINAQSIRRENYVYMTVFYSLWNVNHDETFWENGWKFNPSRFLDKDGNIVPPENEKRQRVSTFGVGKRQCPGGVFARLRIFMALAATLQKFTILPDPASKLPDADPRTFQTHLLLRAPRYKVIFHPRV